MKDIKGYEGLYAITSCGRVWSYRSKKFLKLAKEKNGYMSVCLSEEGRKKKYSIHRLVAEAYIPNPLGLSDVNHKNEDKSKNYINNLEWLSRKNNVRYSQATPVYCIELNRTFDSTREVETELGINHTSVGDVCKGKRKTAGGYHWRYVNEQQ